MLETMMAPPIKEDKELDELRKSFASVKDVGDKELLGVAPLTRVVKLKLTSWCGCGGTTQWIEREVPYDSPLKDGDGVEAGQPGDKKSMEQNSTGKVVNLGILF